MKNEYLYNLLKEQVASGVKRVAKNLSKLSLEDLIKSEKSLQSKIGRLSKAGGSEEELKLAKGELEAVQKQKLKLGQGAGASGDVPAKSAAARVADEEAEAVQGVGKTKAVQSDDASSESLVKKIKQAKAEGASPDEIKALKDELLVSKGLNAPEVDQITKKLIRLENDYKVAVRTGGADSPRAKALKDEMIKLNGDTKFTKIKNFCKKDWKRGGLCLAILGGAGYAAYQALFGDDGDSPTPKPTPKPGPGGGGGGRKCGSTLKSGCKGENVKKLQQKLLDCGEKLPRKGVDGVFGSETKAAVQSFQEDSGLKADGIAGANTMQALNKCNGTSEKETPLANEPQVVDVPATEKDKEEFNKAKADFEKAKEEREALRKQNGSTKEPTGKLKSTPYWMTNKWADVKDSRNSADKEKVKQELISKGYADESNWEDRKSKGTPMQESKIQKNYFLKTISDRHEQVEKLVFERLIKNAS